MRIFIEPTIPIQKVIAAVAKLCLFHFGLFTVYVMGFLLKVTAENNWHPYLVLLSRHIKFVLLSCGPHSSCEKTKEAGQTGTGIDGHGK